MNDTNPRLQSDIQISMEMLCLWCACVWVCSTAYDLLDLSGYCQHPEEIHSSKNMQVNTGN